MKSVIVFSAPPDIYQIQSSNIFVVRKHAMQKLQSEFTLLMNRKKRKGNV